MNPKNLTSFSDISFIFSVLYKLPPAVLCKTPTSRRPDYLHSHKRRQPRTAPRPALPHTRLMNALFVLRPAKLWVFNIGHPCPSLAKGELLLLSQAQPTIEGSPASNLSASAITSANNPSVTVPKKTVLFYTYLT